MTNHGPSPLDTSIRPDGPNGAVHTKGEIMEYCAGDSVEVLVGPLRGCTYDIVEVVDNSNRAYPCPCAAFNAPVEVRCIGYYDVRIYDGTTMTYCEHEVRLSCE